MSELALVAQGEQQHTVRVGIERDVLLEARRRRSSILLVPLQNRFLAIDAFVRVAESRSFADAARPMRVSRSVVTARIPAACNAPVQRYPTDDQQRRSSI